MLRTLIVDDEAPARERLKTLLAQIEAVEIVGEAEDGVQAVELIGDLKPDLVLLDIEMPRLDGFGVVKMLKEPPMIIFITAYDEFAIKAFEVNALDYLLKPITKQRLETALGKAAREISSKNAFTARIEGLFKTLTEQKNHLHRLAVRDQDKILVIDVTNIDTITAESGHVLVHVGSNVYPANYTLNELENRLDPATFFKAHRSTVVNLMRIKEIIPWFAGSYQVKMKNGDTVDLSRIQASELKKIIEW